MIPVNTREMEMYAGGAELFTIDFSDRLAGDQLTGSATWTLSSGSLTKSSETADASSVTVKLACSTPGVYTAAASIGTVGGQTLVDYIRLTVKGIGS